MARLITGILAICDRWWVHPRLHILITNEAMVMYDNVTMALLFEQNLISHQILNENNGLTLSQSQQRSRIKET